ncbi:MAG: GNAT family N-acetyltransferase [Acidobacteria bacterium]|nr:GNAT family N-acetyltransferase [Acidobacteriota bacterium]
MITGVMPSDPIPSGLSLARRLERAEGVAGAQFVETRARVLPESGACWTEIAGTYAMFDGPASPITQTFGLGVFQMPSASDMDAIETFFFDRGAPANHEVSPLADRPLLPMLNERGYRPIELSDVMFLPLAHRPPAGAAPADLEVRLAESAELDVWADTAARGWAEVAEFSGVIHDLMRVSARRGTFSPFLALLDGRPIATGGLVIHEGVALMAGASTVPEFRHRGAQRSLYEERLLHAVRAGCDLAMVCTEPGSASQRNAVRNGFRVAYTRIKWSRFPSRRARGRRSG